MRSVARALLLSSRRSGGGTKHALPSIHSSPALVDRRSEFRAHAARARLADEAAALRQNMHDDDALQLHRASHCMWAVSLVPEAGSEGVASSPSSDDAAPTAAASASARVLSDDDGETGAAIRLTMLLQRMGAHNILVMVTRRYGGTHLGNDRWKHILTVARQAVELVLAEQQQQQTQPTRSKSKR